MIMRHFSFTPTYSEVIYMASKDRKDDVTSPEVTPERTPERTPEVTPEDVGGKPSNENQ
jgi:hypothetical protein